MIVGGRWLGSERVTDTKLLSAGTSALGDSQRNLPTAIRPMAAFRPSVGSGASLKITSPVLGQIARIRYARHAPPWSKLPHYLRSLGLVDASSECHNKWFPRGGCFSIGVPAFRL